MRRLNQGNIYVYYLLSKEAWNLREGGGGVIRHTSVDGLSGAVAYEERIEREVVHEFFICVRNRAQGPYVDKLKAEEGFGIALDVIHRAEIRYWGSPQPVPKKPYHRPWMWLNISSSDASLSCQASFKSSNKLILIAFHALLGEE
jgi:hypothetical protein